MLLDIIFVVCLQAIEKLIVLIFYNVHVTDVEKSDSLMKASWCIHHLPRLSVYGMGVVPCRCSRFGKLTSTSRSLYCRSVGVFI